MKVVNSKSFLVLFSLLSIAFSAEQSTESTTSADTPTTPTPPPAGGHSEEKGDQQKSGEGSTVSAVEPGPSEQKVNSQSAEKSKPEENGGTRSETPKTASPSPPSVSGSAASGSAEVGHSAGSADQQPPANGVPKATTFPLSALSLLAFTVCAFVL